MIANGTFFGTARFFSMNRSSLSLSGVNHSVKMTINEDGLMKWNKSEFIVVN